MNIPDHYKILPVINNWGLSEERIKDGKKVDEGFSYTSNNNSEWMSVETLTNWIEINKNKIGNF